MVKLSDVFYYNFLKKGWIIVAILGILIGILVINYAVHWIGGVSEVSKASTTSCSDSTDCTEHCGECVSIADNRVCEPTIVSCTCINSTCQKTA